MADHSQKAEDEDSSNAPIQSEDLVPDNITVHSMPPEDPISLEKSDITKALKAAKKRKVRTRRKVARQRVAQSKQDLNPLAPPWTGSILEKPPFEQSNAKILEQPPMPQGQFTN
jgi:hypothetical protein